jgi:pilus assembly protein Flp/PilA
MAAVAAVLPGAHADDNGPISAGKLIEVTEADEGPIALDFQAIFDNTNTARLGNNLGDFDGSIGQLVVDPTEQ